MEQDFYEQLSKVSSMLTRNASKAAEFKDMNSLKKIEK
jgi:hypothetical protein